MTGPNVFVHGVGLDRTMWDPLCSLLDHGARRVDVPVPRRSQGAGGGQRISYSYASGVFTRDGGRAMRFARSLRAGVVYVNTYRAISPAVPFGGNGETGYGRESALESLLDYSRPKTVCWNHSSEPMPAPFTMR